MKKLLLSAAAVCCFVSAHAQSNPTTFDNRGYTNVGIRSLNPAYPFQVYDGPNIVNNQPSTNPYTGVSIIPGQNPGESAILHALKNGDKGLLLKAVNQDAARGQAVVFLKSAPHASGFSKVAVTAGNIDFRISTDYNNMAVNDDNVGTSALSIDALTNVTIGTPVAGATGVYKLNVWGRARANEIVVNTNGADFVFADDYRLRPLKEVEQFITANNHLPEIPSAKEMQQNGMAVGELQTKLLQKVEELTLYVIEQNKKVEAQHQTIQEQNRKIEALEKASAKAGK